MFVCFFVFNSNGLVHCRIKCYSVLFIQAFFYWQILKPIENQSGKIQLQVFMGSCSNNIPRNKTFGRNYVIFLTPHPLREHSPVDYFFLGFCLGMLSPTLFSFLGHRHVGSTALPVDSPSGWLPGMADGGFLSEPLLRGGWPSSC